MRGMRALATEEPRLICSFSLRESPCSSASGRTDSGLAVGRSSAASRETPGLQADSRSSELKSFCRPADGRVFACCDAWPAVPANGTFLRMDACRRAASDSDPRGRVRFSVRIPWGRPCPHSDPGEPWLPTVASCPQDSVRGSRALRHGQLEPWHFARVDRRGCRLHRKRASARNRPGLLLVVRGGRVGLDARGARSQREGDSVTDVSEHDGSRRCQGASGGRGPRFGAGVCERGVAVGASIRRSRS